jgi:surface antigen
MHGLVFTMALGVIAASRLSSQGPQLPPPPDATSIAASAPVNPANAIVARVLTTTQVTAIKPSPDAGGGIIAQAALSIAGFDRAAFNIGLPVTLPAPPAAAAPAPPVKPAPKIQDYEVQDGDNPYDLAGQFGISEETLLAANSMDADSTLQIGEHVLIPPVTGVMVTTQQGDTVNAIADQWKIDPAKLISANQLPAGAQALVAGEPLVIPDAQPAVSIYTDGGITLAPSPAAGAKPLLKAASPVAAAAPRVTVPAPPPITKPAVAAPAHSINWFPYGQCTWWAANQRPDIGTRVVGNASAWAYSARAAGLATGVVPRVGAVVVYQPGAQGAGWVGHVAYVTSVSGNSFTISEMNFNAWGRVDTRQSWTGPGVSFIY